MAQTLYDRSHLNIWVFPKSCSLSSVTTNLLIYAIKTITWNCNLLCNGPMSYHTSTKSQATDMIFKFTTLSDLTEFSEFHEFNEVCFHLGKTLLFYQEYGSSLQVAENLPWDTMFLLHSFGNFPYGSVLLLKPEPNMNC